MSESKWPRSVDPRKGAYSLQNRGGRSMRDCDEINTNTPSNDDIYSHQIDRFKHNPTKLSASEEEIDRIRGRRLFVRKSFLMNSYTFLVLIVAHTLLACILFGEEAAIYFVFLVVAFVILLLFLVFPSSSKPFRKDYHFYLERMRNIGEGVKAEYEKREILYSARAASYKEKEALYAQKDAFYEEKRLHFGIEDEKQREESD